MSGAYAVVAQGEDEEHAHWEAGAVREMVAQHRRLRGFALALVLLVAVATGGVLWRVNKRHDALVARASELNTRVREFVRDFQGQGDPGAAGKAVEERLQELSRLQEQQQIALDALAQKGEEQGDLLRAAAEQATERTTPTPTPTATPTPTPTPTPPPLSTPANVAAPVASLPPPSVTPHNQQAIPISYNGELFWDGEYDTFPRPIPATFAGPPSKEAVGRRAYVTMISTRGQPGDQYACLGLAMLTSLQRTKPHPSIDVVLVVLVDDDDLRFRKIRQDDEQFAKVTPLDVLGEDWKRAYEQAGVTRFVVWKELDTRGREGMQGGWKQGFSKLRVWSLTDFEKIIFLDSDTFILKNLDHLFAEPEFTAARTWDCGNPNSSLRPSGGFWVLTPSENTWGLIQTYIAGRDPCGKRWRLGDMMMTYILFMDIESFANPDPKGWPKFDGDRPSGRCRTPNMYPARIDFLTNHNDNYHQPTGELSPRNRWKMLNESYDVLVGPCWRMSFSGGGHEWDDRYNQRRGNGTKTFDRPDAFSIHFSCGPKPPCVRNREKEASHHPCITAAFDWWYDALKEHYFGPQNP